MDSTEPIGPSRVIEPYSIKNVPPLIIGGAVFNTLYTEDPYKLPASEILEVAFSKGLNAIDTSPYYGPSEQILGDALAKLESKWPRNSYYLSTKAGRIAANEFDYSRENVRKSLFRSLQRLGTDYVDLVFMHDVEFVADNEIFEALKELSQLRKEGYIKNIGVSGYPVDLLRQVAFHCKETYGDSIGALDVVLSYSNGCIQNTRFFDIRDDLLTNCGVKKVFNGSILSMSLLRSQKPHKFHPASDELKAKVQEVAQHLQEKYQIELADLATRFALRKTLFDEPDKALLDKVLEWNRDHSVVLGVSNLEELDIAISNYLRVKNNIDNINDKDDPIFEEVKTVLGPLHYNETWKSGISHNLG